MELVVLKYVQLVCITIFMQNNANCAQLMSQTEEMNNIKVAACTANCIDLDRSYVSVKSFAIQIILLCFIECSGKIKLVNSLLESHLLLYILRGPNGDARRR